MEEVTAAQAAALTGRSERTIRRKIAAGELPARRVAPNRFAINLRDLPMRRAGSDLAAQFDVLERRVRLLEQRLDALSPGVLGSTAASVGPPIGGEAMATIQDLVLQLAREAARLGPLLAPADLTPRPLPSLGEGTEREGVDEADVQHSREAD